MSRVIHSLWPWQGSCLATAAPDAPFGLSASGVTSSTITLNFDDSTSSPNEATSYEIGISSNGGSTWTTNTLNVTGAPPVAYQFTGLSSSTTYAFRVRGVNCAGAGMYDGEAFSQATAAGSIAPSWSLDFSSGTPSGYTLTRASTGTYVDSSGYIASASTDVARLTHNSSGSRLGLLVEGQRTNLSTQSKTIANWLLLNTTRTANSTTSPDNTTNASRFVETSATGSHQVYMVDGSQPTATVLSVYAKKDQRDCLTLNLYAGANIWMACTFDLTNGTAGTMQFGSSSTWTSTEAVIEAAGNGWYRCQIRGQRSSGTETVPVFGLATSATPTLSSAGGIESYAGNTANGLWLWGANWETVNSRASSLIETTTATVTRSADLAHMLDSAITSWGDPGALVVHFYPPGQAGTILSTDDAATAQVGIEASTTTAARAFWSSGSTATGTIGSGVQKAVHYWNGSTSKFCINGGTVQSGTNNFTIANADFVTLGAEATDSSGVPGTFSQYANCVIRKVEFYSGTLTDANLQTITT